MARCGYERVRAKGRHAAEGRKRGGEILHCVQDDSVKAIDKQRRMPSTCNVASRMFAVCGGQTATGRPAGYGAAKRAREIQRGFWQRYIGCRVESGDKGGGSDKYLMRPAYDPGDRNAVRKPLRYERRLRWGRWGGPSRSSTIRAAFAARLVARLFGPGGA
jgi:hypothetical protein